MRTSTFTAWDRALGGNLTGWLTDWRADDVAYAEIAHRLRVNHDVTVTAETVRRWCVELGITKTQSEGAA